MASMAQRQRVLSIVTSTAPTLAHRRFAGSVAAVIGRLVADASARARRSAVNATFFSWDFASTATKSVPVFEERRYQKLVELSIHTPAPGELTTRPSTRWR